VNCNTTPAPEQQLVVTLGVEGPRHRGIGPAEGEQRNGSGDDGAIESEAQCARAVQPHADERRCEETAGDEQQDPEPEQDEPGKKRRRIEDGDVIRHDRRTSGEWRDCHRRGAEGGET
jgi:hypothetical protein